MTDETIRRPAWDDRTDTGKARDFADPPREDPPDQDIAPEPPEENGGEEG